MRIPAVLRIGAICFVIAGSASYAQAQSIRVPTPRKAPTPAATAPTTSTVASSAAAPAAGPAAPVAALAAAAAAKSITPPSNLVASPRSDSQIDIGWTAATETGGTIAKYEIWRCQNMKCQSYTANFFSTTTNYRDTGLVKNTVYYYAVFAIDDASGYSGQSNVSSATTTSNFVSCAIFPTRPSCMKFGSDADTNLNTFYSTNGGSSFFNQIKSIYNGASGAATVSADVGTFNVDAGMQITLGTNVQAGSSGTTTVSSGTVPTLSSNGAGQATQNMLSGGTFVASVLYPVLAIGASKENSPDNFGILLDVIGKEGADIQNFKSGTSISVTSPPTHTSAHIEGYLQYNSTHLATSSSDFAGAVFIGGSYGYDYTSHGYARDYGFGNRVQNDLGQVSVGILINGVAKIVVSRAFGPSQTYIDSTSKTQTTVNNFKAWSFGITYQKAPASK